MIDTVSPKKRSEIMSHIKGKDTSPELMIRKGLHNLGYRYILHDKRLAGNPDLVFPKYNLIIEVNGCFWHAHNCHIYRLPKSNKSYWAKKIKGNVSRDKENWNALLSQGWRVLLIWECALKGKTSLEIDDVLGKAENFIHSNIAFEEIEGTNN